MADNRHPSIRLVTESPEETRALGGAIGRRCRGGEVIFLSGQLGAGKTTFVQGFARGLGIVGQIRSPSFVLERIYRGDLTLRHIDLYRLGASEAEDSGLLSEIEDTEVVVVEWADRVWDTLAADLVVRIDVPLSAPSKRSILIEALSLRWESLLSEIKRVETGG